MEKDAECDVVKMLRKFLQPIAEATGTELDEELIAEMDAYLKEEVPRENCLVLRVPTSAR